MTLFDRSPRSSARFSKRNLPIFLLIATVLPLHHPATANAQNLSGLPNAPEPAQALLSANTTASWSASIGLDLDTPPQTAATPSTTSAAKQPICAINHIGRCIKDLGEDEDWLSDVAYGMDPEDGLIWVFGLGDDGIMAFTDFGIENLVELIRIHKENPELLKR